MSTKVHQDHVDHQYNKILTTVAQKSDIDVVANGNEPQGVAK